MRTIRNLFFIGMILGTFSLNAQEEKDVPSTRIDKQPYYLKTDTLTGEKKEIPIKNFLDRWVTKNLKYLERGIEEGIQGRVIVILTIDEKGILSIKEIRGVILSYEKNFVGYLTDFLNSFLPYKEISL